MDAITIIASLAFVVCSYIFSSYHGGLLLHIACAILFTLGIYQSSDISQDDSFYIRDIVPIAITISGLIFVLWFIGVNMSVVVHIIIVSIINFISFTFFVLPSIVKLIKNHEDILDCIEDDEFDSEEETEDEIRAKEDEKKAKRDLKMEQIAYNRL